MADPEFSFEDLTTPLTADEVKASIYEALAILGVNTSSWRRGSPLSVTIAATSIVIAGLSSLQALIARSGFLALSDGPWLTLVARHVYGVEREAATFASGSITLTNGGGGEYELDPEDLIFRNPTTDKTYRNTAAIRLGPFSSATISIRASEAGAASSAAIGAIDDMTTPLSGVACSNPVALLGLDTEADSALRTRCTEKLGSLSPMGPWDAYTSAVRNARRPDGSSLGITRVRLTKDGYGNVDLYCATSTGTGELSVEDNAIADDAVQRLATPHCVTAHVYSAEAEDIAVTYELWMYNTSGKSGAEVAALVHGKLDHFMRTQPIGGIVVGSDPGKVFVSAIAAVIGSALPEIFRVAVTVPASDVTLEGDEVPLLGSVAASVHIVPPNNAPPN